MVDEDKMKRLMEAASNLSVSNFDIQDSDKVILDLFESIYHTYGNVWVLQTQVVQKLNTVSNVKMKLEKLAMKGLLELKLFDRRVVYRMKIKQ